MTTYQNVVAANLPFAAWSFTEAAGVDFAPYNGFLHLTGSAATFLYQQAGPFATSFGLHIPSGTWIDHPLAGTLGLSNWWECWYKFDAYPPPIATYLFYNGNAALNGNGVYVATNGHLHFQSNAQDVDTGVEIGAGWHLVQTGQSPAQSNSIMMLLDGRLIFQQVPAANAAAAPATFTISNDSRHAAISPLSIAMAARYTSDRTLGQLSATFLAKTDPQAALGLAVTGGAGLATADNALLLDIQGGLFATFKNTP